MTKDEIIADAIQQGLRIVPSADDFIQVPVPRHLYMDVVRLLAQLTGGTPVPQGRAAVARIVARRTPA